MSELEAIRRAARPISGAGGDYDALLELVGDARVVLLGEASHGTHEFYAERARITRRLIEEKGFSAVAVEADWPDAYRVNCHVRVTGTDADAGAALADFARFPRWMWRNGDVAELVDWLRAWNGGLPDGAPRVGFYGIDLYSLRASMEAVVAYLARVDPTAAARARERYACFDHAGDDDGQRYGRALAIGAAEDCEDEVVDQLLELRRRAGDLPGRDGRVPADGFFYAEQNARLVVGAERFYRSMFLGRQESWNLRDRHMAETVDALAEHLSAPGAPARIVVWAHNSHVGDARATEMGRHGELSLGQLVREAHGDRAVTVGFTTATGTVTAARDWGAPAERRDVRPPLDGSWEALLHASGLERFLLLSGEATEPTTGTGLAAEALREPRLERAIGVVYRPETERVSHYFQADLTRQFDAIVHIDDTSAVRPLDPGRAWREHGLAQMHRSAS